MFGQFRSEWDLFDAGELHNLTLYHNIGSKPTSDFDSTQSAGTGTLLGTIKLEAKGSWVRIPGKALAEIEDRKERDGTG